MAISLKELVGERKSPGEKVYSNRNLHMKVVDYERKPDGIRVRGIDLVTGEDVKVALADNDKFVQFYTSAKDDKSIRQDYARRMLQNRPQLSDFAATRGNKAVPPGGVISFSDVRKDLSTGELYARWPQGMVHIPEAEAALTGMFEVKPVLAKGADGQAVKTSYINYIDVKSAFDPSKQDDVKAVFDEVFSAKFLETESPARTGALVSLKMPDGIGSFLLSTPSIPNTVDGNKVYMPLPGADAAVSQKLKLYNAVAAVTVAAFIGKNIDDLDLSEVPDKEKASLHELYKEVQKGEIKVAVTPSMQLSPTRFQNNDFFGVKKQQDGSLKEAKTASANFLDRGYFPGVVGVRLISQTENKIIPPIVKAIQADSRLPAKSSDSYVRLDLNALSEMAFLKIEERAKQQEVELKNDKENEREHENNNVHEEEEEEASYEAEFDTPSAEF